MDKPSIETQFTLGDSPNQIITPSYQDESVSKPAFHIKNTILYFTSNIKNCGHIKLCNMLYFLDYTHYLTTGVTWTGFKYRACAFRTFIDKIIAEYIDIKYIEGRDVLIPKIEYDVGYFSKHSKKIMDDLIEYFNGYTCLEIEEIESIEIEFKEMKEIFG